MMSASSTEMDSDAHSEKSVKQPMWLYANQKNGATQTQTSHPNKRLPSRKGSNTTTEKRSSRGGTRVEHTIEQKLEVIQEYKRLNKSGMKEDYAKSVGVSTRTITRWINKEKAFLKAKEQGRGRKKTIYNKDGLLRIKLGLMKFYEENNGRDGADKLNITASVLSAQALKIKDRLLKLHNEKKLSKPLDLEEVAAIRSFNASESWSGKIASENGWTLLGRGT